MFRVYRGVIRPKEPSAQIRMSTNALCTHRTAWPGLPRRVCPREGERRLARTPCTHQAICIGFYPSGQHPQDFAVNAPCSGGRPSKTHTARGDLTGNSQDSIFALSGGIIGRLCPAVGVASGCLQGGGSRRAARRRTCERDRSVPR